MLFGAASAIVYPFFGLASASIGDLLQTAPRQVGDYFGCCSALVRLVADGQPNANRSDD
ncbi:hypothetical protein [Sphingobacterium multivorum]|uniref:hypothetical protein n=1 Tax=Sphingobacterium multivorum TaxID=28454 RepID=UPI00155952D6|nr:hypothetical protein [Sphingobacterium multivorum]QRQ63408.1 hypothetical protein I6J33_10755 [Sphingobacterium multivorum]